MTELERRLKLDPLARAEELTGVSYKDKAAGDGFDNPAVALGFLMMQENAAAKERLLTEADDTTMLNDLSRYRRIIESYGFELVLADEWVSSWGHRETYFIFAHRKGLLLSFDTYNGTRVNGGNVYYNWKPSVPWDEVSGCLSSGGMSGEIWVGHHDCREALIHNLNKLNNRGEFVAPWARRPFLWLLHYDDSKTPGYDYAAITESRIKRLPAWVQEMLGVDGELMKGPK